jgi:hypothetical protein
MASDFDNWGIGWKRQGECVICGVTGPLEVMCLLCEKWSCRNEECMRLVQDEKRCAVKAVGR